jgi:hypothetical protein
MNVEALPTRGAGLGSGPDRLGSGIHDICYGPGITDSDASGSGSATFLTMTRPATPRRSTELSCLDKLFFQV